MGSRAIGIVVSIAFVVAGCASQIRSNLVIGRPAPTCEPGADPVSCYQQQITLDRPGHCFEQTPQPGEQILKCDEEKHSHLTPAGKTWITVGAVGAGLLVTAYVVFVVVTFIQFSNDINSTP